MKLLSQLSPDCVEAVYRPSRLPHFAGNCLIEALPPALDPDEALAQYASSPPFEFEQRTWKVSERVQMLKTLASCLMPLERHIALACELDSMLMNGYVGRQPGTAESAKRRQRIYQEMMTEGRCTTESVSEQYGLHLSLLVMGLSGMGKTEFIRRWAKRFPKVIYHREHNCYQIPVLHIEIPSNGMSVKTLCAAIFKELDARIPDANYSQEYMRRSPNTDVLMLNVAKLLEIHNVGVLVCDELQNLTNAGKSQAVLMTELVSLSNVVNVPLVFIGTNKASRLFASDFSKARRTGGFGSQHWDRLHEGELLDDGRVLSEWREFAEFLWTFQWTKKPVHLTEEILIKWYWCCQGVMDTAIKLFAGAQARAIVSGGEELTKELLQEVYDNDLKPLHPMLDALRSNDLKALADFEDIQPLSGRLDDIITSAARRGKSLLPAAVTVKPNTPDFVLHVAQAVHGNGFPLESAHRAAVEVVKEARAKTLVQAIQLAMAKLTPSNASPTRTSTPKKSYGKSGVAVTAQDFSERPDDLRGHVQFAKNSGRDVVEVMYEAGAIRPLEKILNFGLVAA